jgi:hypothetical protein
MLECLLTKMDANKVETDTNQAKTDATLKELKVGPEHLKEEMRAGQKHLKEENVGRIRCPSRKDDGWDGHPARENGSLSRKDRGH